MQHTQFRPWWEKLFFPFQVHRRLSKSLLRRFEISAHRHFSIHELTVDMGMTSIGDQIVLGKALRRLQQKGKIEQIYTGTFRLRDCTRFTGVVDLSCPQRPMLISSGRCPVYILPDRLRGASHGDTVLAGICRETSTGLEAKVLRVIRFAQRIVVGKLEVLEHSAYLLPINREFYCDIEIPFKYIRNAQNGDCVVVQFDHHGHKNARRMYGKVIQVLGERTLPAVKNLAWFYSNGFPARFTPEEEEAAAAVDFGLSSEEIAKRRDMRKVMTFTIDPPGCRDIDDALSIRMLKNGNWEVGVHIADVTHYLAPGSILDKQAYGRSTAVYLADRILPLFPEAFMKGCSLYPQEDKAAFSVIFELDKEAQIVSRKMERSVVCSRRQFSYEEAQTLFDESPNGDFAEALATLFMLSRKLRNRRLANGSIAFESGPDFVFEYDNMERVVDIKPCYRFDTMSLVEEFMLLANRTVAEIAAGKRLPFIYRVHGNPKIDKSAELCRLAKNYGYSVHKQDVEDQWKSSSIAWNISGLLGQVKNTRNESMFRYLAVHSMSQGMYSHVPRRHFGLAFNHYTHFTSPIRRYVDVVVHRILTGEVSGNCVPTGIFDYEEACRHFNRMRQKAKTVEQNSEQKKCAEFLQNQIGQRFACVVVFLTSRCMEVELSGSGIRGKIVLKSMMDDHYRLNYEDFTIAGIHSGRCYRIGDRLQVRLASVSVEYGQILFTISV